MKHISTTRAEIEHKWGSLVKQTTFTEEQPLLSEFISWDELSPDSKSLIINIVAHSFGCFGTIYSDPDSYWVLQNIRTDLIRLHKFQNRSAPIVISTIELLQNSPTSYLAAAITPFLFSEIEKRFRVSCSDFVKIDGTRIKQVPYSLANHTRMNHGPRINNLADVYSLFLFTEQNEPLVSAFRSMEKNYEERKIKEAPTLTDYLNKMRNLFAHGQWNALSTEAFFLTAMLGHFIIHTSVYE